MMGHQGDLLRRALRYYGDRQYSDAERTIEEMIAQDPHFDKAWFLKGVILLEKGRQAEAQGCFDRLLNVSSLWLRLALQLQDTDPERALFCYKTVLHGDPKNNYALYGSGVILEKMGHINESREFFKRIAPLRELVFKLFIPLGFMVLLAVGAVMLFARGEAGLAIVLVLSSMFCVFWLNRDASLALRMFKKRIECRG